MSFQQSTLRLWLIILLIANILLFGYGFSKLMEFQDGKPPHAPLLNPEYIKLLSPKEVLQRNQIEISPSATAEPSTAVRIVPDTALNKIASNDCLAWTDLNSQEAAVLTKNLRENYTNQIKIEKKPSAPKALWWVYVPPQPQGSMLKAMSKELQTMGIKDYFFIDNGRPEKNMIALGVFSTEAAARKRLSSIRKLGVSYARLGPRIKGQGIAVQVFEKRDNDGLPSIIKQQALQWLPDHAAQGCK